MTAVHRPAATRAIARRQTEQPLRGNQCETPSQSPPSAFAAQRSPTIRATGPGWERHLGQR